jgi:hypothetical protein
VGHFDRVEIGAVGGQEQEPGSFCSDRIFGDLALVSREVVENNNVALIQGWSELRSDPGLKDGPVHRLIDDKNGIVRTAEGKLYLYVAIDRTSKFAFVQLVKQTGRTSASAFLQALIKAVPYKIHTVLTDNGIQFTFPRVMRMALRPDT